MNYARLLIAAALLAPMTTLPAAAIAQKAKPAATASFKLDPARIDKTLDAMVADGRVAGASALVWQSGKERYFHAIGLADREAARPMARDTLVQIFSMTKPVTGVALMQLWEQGKFGLDDPLSRYLPEFADQRYFAGKDASGVPLYRPVSRPTSIRDILRHTGGLSYGGAETPADALFTAANPLNLDNDLAAMAKAMGPLPLVYDPGTQWRYSSGVDVQARLVEVLSGQKFTDYVQQHIFDPLGMKDSGWARSRDVLPRFAAGYSNGADGKLARVPDAQAQAMSFSGKKMTMGGAGIVAPIDDYMRFARMLLGGGSLDGVRILKPSTVRLMATDHLDARVTERSWLPGKGSVGFGFDFTVRVSQPKDAKENRGAVGEYFWDGAASTLFWVDPANDLAAVFFVQKFPFDGTLHHDFREAVYGKDYLGPAGD